MTSMIGRSCNPATSYSSCCNHRPIPSPLRSSFATIASSDPILPKTSSLRFQSKGARSKEKTKAQWRALQSDVISSHEEMAVDVVVVGAGIIGLAIANQILAQTKFSVAVVDAAQPCAGATGAGQGYIWANHRNPTSKSWGLARYSMLLWEQLVSDLERSGTDSFSSIGWQNTGSLLVASSAEHVNGLQDHVERLNAAGINAEYLTATALLKVEPSLAVDSDGGAAFVAEDSQLDAALAVGLFRERNRQYQSQGRFKELLDSPVQRLFRSPVDGCIEAVQTSRHKIHCRKAVVMAAGAWSASILTDAADEWSLPVIPPVKPRKGHLLVLEGAHLKLDHGLMEFEYTTNYREEVSQRSLQPPDAMAFSEANTSMLEPHKAFGVAMTATIDTSGRLLLGSSRQFTGFDETRENEVLECIFKRATKFLPALKEVSFQEALAKGTIRTGLRPYVAGGVPLIGPVPGLQGLFLATGHEGSGLCMALGTAEIIVAMLLGKEVPINVEAHLPAGRLTVEAHSFQFSYSNKCPSSR